MAETNFEVFDEGNRGLMDDADYKASPQRLNGVALGVADPALHNKLYRQVSVMCAALARLCTERGNDAMDSDLQALAASLRASLGEQGEAATIEVGTVTTGEPGAEASVTNSGTSGEAVLDFVLPRGDVGPEGPQGIQGDPGLMNPAGEYDDATQYHTLDIVSKDGSSYLVSEDVKGIAPPNTEYYQPIADVSAAIAATDEAAANANAARDAANTAKDAANAAAEAAQTAATDAAAKAEAATSDLAATALRTSASRFAFVADGNPITIYPAAGSPISVTPSADGTLTHNEQTREVTAGTSIELTAIEDVNTLSATTGTLSVSYNRDSMDVIKQLSAPVTATGPVARIDGCIDGLPLDVTAHTVATQAGTGDPSPDNVRAIAGVSAVKIPRIGKNMWPIRVSGTSNGVTMTVSVDSTVTLNGTSTAITSFGIAMSPMLPPGTYAISANNPVAVGTGISSTVVLRALLDNGSVMPGSETICSTANANAVFTVTTQRVTVLNIRIAPGVTLTNYVIRPQLELGPIANPYTPYVGNIYTLTLPEPVYGLASAPDEVRIYPDGSWDEVRRTANIPSYSDEHIPGAYISSMGGLITGAQVVYALDTPVITHHASGAITIPALPGTNTAYSDAGGDTTITGRMSAQGMMDTLQTQITALQALIT